MTKINLPHGTTRSTDMSSEVRYAWQGDTLTEHDLTDDGGTDSWKLWRDDEVHAEWDADGLTEIDVENRIAVIEGRAYGMVVGSGDPDDDVPLDRVMHYLGDDLLPLCNREAEGGYQASPVVERVTCTYCLGNLTARETADAPPFVLEPARITPPARVVPGGAWLNLAAILSHVDSERLAHAEHLAHMADAGQRAAMLGMLATAVRLLGSADEQTPDAPLVIDPRIAGLSYVTAGGLPAIEIYTGRGSDPEIYTITADGEYVRLTR